VVLGDDETFNVRQDIIYAASLFVQKCISSPLPESFCNIVNLPEDDSAIFQTIRDWVCDRFHKHPQNTRIVNPYSLSSMPACLLRSGEPSQTVSI
jgi:hypothetical protein